MDKHAIWKWLLLIVFTAFSLALVIPPAQKVKLGLDLKGGMSFTVQINRAEIEKQLREEYKDLAEKDILSKVPVTVKHGHQVLVQMAEVHIRVHVDFRSDVPQPQQFRHPSGRIQYQRSGQSEMRA